MSKEMSSGLSKMLSTIEKRHGKGAMFRLGDSPKVITERVSTGSIALDSIIGGGWPATGAIVELYGMEASGKSTLAMHAVAEFQKAGYVGAYIDAEHTFDPSYAEMIGINVDELFFSQPDSGDQALEILRDVVRSGEIRIAIIDSVAALTPRAELEGEIGDSKMGLQARMMSQAMRMLTAEASKHKCTLIFINQLRENIGVMFGETTVTTGGKALKFYSTIRVEVKASTKIKSGDDIIGAFTNILIKKNKTFPPFKKTAVTLMYGLGFDKASELINLGVELEIIKKAGSWYSYKEVKLGQGQEAVRGTLLDNPELMEELEILITKEFAI